MTKLKGLLIAPYVCEGWQELQPSIVPSRFRKARIGATLDNPVLKTEGRGTLVDAYLAGAVLVGLMLNALVGWWWADPMAGLVIVFYSLGEGLGKALHYESP